MTDEDTRCSIMNASLDILSEKGFQELRFSEIAERADISKSLINYHFDSKEELVSELFDWMAEETLERKEEDEKRDLEALMELLLPEEEENRRIQKSMLEIGTACGDESRIQESYRELNRKLKKGIMESGKDITEKDADTLLSTVTGAVFRREMLGEEIDREQINRQLQKLQD